MAFLLHSLSPTNSTSRCWLYFQLTFSALSHIIPPIMNERMNRLVLCQGTIIFLFIGLPSILARRRSRRNKKGKKGDTYLPTFSRYRNKSYLMLIMALFSFAVSLAKVAYFSRPFEIPRPPTRTILGIPVPGSRHTCGDKQKGIDIYIGH